MKLLKRVSAFLLAGLIFLTPIAHANMEVEDGKINGEEVVSIELHGDHYHIKTESGAGISPMMIQVNNSQISR